MKPKAKVYIDGANMFYTQKKLGWFIDWKKMKDYLKEKWDILGIRYYTGIKPTDEKMASFLRYLDIEASEYIYLEDIEEEIKRE